MDRKDYYHCAKLSLFNVRLLAELEALRPTVPQVGDIITRLAQQNGLQLPFSLMHQSTFLGQAFITFVWLAEYLYDKYTDAERRLFHSEFAKRFSLDKDTIKRSAEPIPGADGIAHPVRDLNNHYEFFRTLRNALAHASVHIDDNLFVFDSKSKHDRAVIRMTWAQLGAACDATLFAHTACVYL